MISFSVLVLVVCSALQIFSAPQYYREYDEPQYQSTMDHQYQPPNGQQSNDGQSQVPGLSHLQNNIPQMPQVPNLNDIQSKLPQSPDLSQMQNNLPQMPNLNGVQSQMPHPISNIQHNRPFNVPPQHHPQYQPTHNLFSNGLNFLNDVSSGLSVQQAAAAR